MEGSRRLCIHIEVDEDADGKATGGKAFVSWGGTIQRTVEHSTYYAGCLAVSEVAFQDLFDASLCKMRGREKP